MDWSKWFGFNTGDIPNMVTEVKAADGDDFIYILDMLYEESNRGTKQRALYQERSILAEHLRLGTLFVLKFDFEKYTNQFKGIYRAPTSNVMPAFCICTQRGTDDMEGGNTIEMVWVHKDVRRKGLGTRLVRHFLPAHVLYISDDLKPFWDKARATEGEDVNMQ